MIRESISFLFVSSEYKINKKQEYIKLVALDRDLGELQIEVYVETSFFRD